jgi:UPF0716 protein FxsA
VAVLVVVFVIVPLVELYVLVQVAHAIGVLPALVTLALVSVCGAALVKHQGIGLLGRIRRELEQHRMPTEHLADGALLLGAGVLLTVPGFVTDAVGLLLLVPPVRRAVAALLRRRWSRRARPIGATYSGRITIIDTETAVGGGEPRPDAPQELPRP